MLHLFVHTKKGLKGKFDFAFVKKGRYIFGSRQGYNRKSGCHKAMIDVIDNCMFDGDQQTYTIFQDDTTDKPTVWKLWDDGTIVSCTSIKAKKKYIPA